MCSIIRVMKKSFTLIEILVVIVVIGVLSAFILVGMSSITNSANIAKAKAFSNSLRNSLLINLVSEWKLDLINSPGANQTPDAWGTNTGTLGDGSTSTTFPTLSQNSSCVSGKCLSFDGGDYVSIPTAIGYSSKVTVEAWMNTSYYIDGTWKYIATGGCGDIIWGTPSDNLGRISFGGQCNNPFTPLTGNTFIANGKWHHVVGIYDKDLSTNQVKIYIDGLLDGQKNATGTFTSGVITFGRGNGVTHFVGLIDEVRIYNAAMPVSKLQQNYFIGINNLYKNNGITLNEFNQRIVELKSNIANSD